MADTALPLIRMPVSIIFDSPLSLLALSSKRHETLK